LRRDAPSKKQARSSSASASKGARERERQSPREIVGVGFQFGAACKQLSARRRSLGEVFVKVTSVFFLFVLVRGRRQARNPTLAKIMRLAYTRKHSNTPPQTTACNAVWKNGSRTLMIARLEHQVLLPRQVSMKLFPQLSPFTSLFALGRVMGRRHPMHDPS